MFLHLRSLCLPAYAVGQRKFVADAPRVLTVKEGALLALGSIQAGAYIALELGDVAEKERSQSETIRSRIPGPELIEE